MTSRPPLRARLFLLSYRGFKALKRSVARALRVIKVVLVGCWLGLLDREMLHQVDQLCYDEDARYLDPAYNRQGLWGWEERAISEHFGDCRRLMVTAAGGGREVVALSGRGLEVEGYECNEKLRQVGNHVLAEDGLAARIHEAPRDASPQGSGTFDGVIIGWGAFTLIKGRSHRVALLAALLEQMKPGAPLLVSFFTVDEGYLRWYRMTARIGGWVSRICSRERPEVGDVLDPNFQHYFDQEAITSELDEAGFDLIRYSTEGYGHAVARSRRE